MCSIVLFYQKQKRDLPFGKTFSLIKGKNKKPVANPQNATGNHCVK